MTRLWTWGCGSNARDVACTKLAHTNPSELTGNPCRRPLLARAARLFKRTKAAPPAPAQEAPKPDRSIFPGGMGPWMFGLMIAAGATLLLPGMALAGGGAAVAGAGGLSYWAVHGIIGGIFLGLMLAGLPRLSLAFLALVSGSIGVSFWGLVGWAFAPRLLVAIIATTVYWQTNPFLVVLSWAMAFGGETAEKVAVGKGTRRR